MRESLLLRLVLAGNHDVSSCNHVTCCRPIAALMTSYNKLRPNADHPLRRGLAVDQARLDAEVFGVADLDPQPFESSRAY